MGSLLIVLAAVLFTASIVALVLALRRPKTAPDMPSDISTGELTVYPAPSA